MKRRARPARRNPAGSVPQARVTLLEDIEVVYPRPRGERYRTRSRGPLPVRINVAVPLQGGSVEYKPYLDFALQTSWGDVRWVAFYARLFDFGNVDAAALVSLEGPPDEGGGVAWRVVHLLAPGPDRVPGSNRRPDRHVTLEGDFPVALVLEELGPAIDQLALWLAQFEAAVLALPARPVREVWEPPRGREQTLYTPVASLPSVMRTRAPLEATLATLLARAGWRPSW